MTTELYLQDAKLMKTIIDPMLAVGEDIYVEISEKGFRAHIQDIIRSWAADAFIHKSQFDRIEVEGSAVYYIKLKDFADFLKTVQNNDELLIRENEETSSLELELKSDMIEKKIVLRLNQLPDNFQIMEFFSKKDKLPSHSTLQVDLFSQAVKAAELGGNEVTLTHTVDGLHFASTDASNTSAEAHIHYDNESVSNVEFKGEKEPQKAIYQLSYLKHVSRVGKSDQDLDVFMANNGPLVLVYSFSANDEDIGYLGFAIAPRMKE